jgi:hypothetical protein
LEKGIRQFVVGTGGNDSNSTIHHDQAPGVQDEALSELDDTRRTAERELDAIKGRKEVLADLERNRDALLGHYARMVPEAFDALTPEERRQVYGMLRLRIDVAADGSMEVRGILSENLCVLYENGQVICDESLCENGLASRCKNQNTKRSELRFRALLTEGGAERLELARV